MTDLTDTQTLILSTACARENGLIFPVTANLKGGAVGNVCKSLLKRGLIEEVPAADPDTVWRHGEAGSLTLRATQLAYSALGLGTAKGAAPAVQPDQTLPIRRNGTKQAQLIAMLRAPEGATIIEIMVALDWAAHTIRGAMAGALKKKLGLEVTSEKVEGRGRVYRLPRRVIPRQKCYAAAPTGRRFLIATAADRGRRPVEWPASYAARRYGCPPLKRCLDETTSAKHS